MIVGGGASSALLAYKLGSQGVKVLILEKCKLPRYKPCGGGLTKKARQKLPFDVNPVIEISAKGGIVSYRGKQLLKVDTLDPIAFLISRSRFDQYLIEKAISTGVKFLDGITVTHFDNQKNEIIVESEKERFITNLLVGADGVSSIVARSYGLITDRQVGVAIEAEVNVTDAAILEQGPYATFDFGALRFGYGWIFPKSDHFSVGVFRAKNGSVPGFIHTMERFITSHTILKKAKIIQLKGHLIPLGGGFDLVHKGRTLLVGDAANLADPWLGEGLNYAFGSALIAADVIKEALDSGTLDLSNYSKRIHQEIVNELIHARHIARIIYRLPSIGSLFLSRSPLMQECIFGNLCGNITFNQLEHRLLEQIMVIILQALKKRN